MRGRLCYRITGLEPEQEYEIQAAAHTEHGDWGEWSEPLITPTGIQIIPVLEAPLELDFVHSTSIGVRWRGLDEKDAEHIVGYILEYKSEDDTDWTEWNGVVRHRSRQPEYKATVKGLIESTEYFFRLRVGILEFCCWKRDKRGGPGPELKAITKCGKPEQPPGNVRIEPVDFQQVKIVWEPPDETTWKCDQVNLALHYTNASGQQRTMTFPPDGPKEVLFDSVPGTRWEAKMRTETVEPGEEPKHSGWSNRAVLVTKAPPSEIFLKTNALGPTQGEAFWGLPAEYADWPWGVDLQYRLLQLGGCKKLDKSMTQPVVLENVQDKHVLLDNLYPGSEYEVTVTLRQPPGYDRRIPPKKAVQRFKTEDQPPTGAHTNYELKAVKTQNWALVGNHQNVWNRTEKLVNTNMNCPRTRADIGELQPGSLYRFRVRAFTSAGPGPWSEPIDARTTGSEIGPPRDLTALKTADTFVELAWLPPHPETSTITAYRVRYGPSADTSRTQEIILRGDELTCSGYESSSAILTTGDRLCTTVTGLKQLSTYRFAVQAQASSGNWGPFTPDIFATTSSPIVGELYEGGNIKLLSAGHDNLKIKWTPPGILAPTIDRYELLIAMAAPLETAKRYDTPGSQTDYHFKGLNPITLYNITVRGLQDNKSKWTISGTFATTDKTEPTELDWLGPPTDLRLIEKSDTMLHVTWTPPDIFEPEYRDLLTHYRVTIAPVDEYTMKMGPRKNYTVMVPGNSIKFTELQPETIYNITVQGGTDVGYGQMIWGAWATLPTGKTWILRLKDRTPNTLTVEWEPIWGFSHRGYILTAKSLHSIYPHVRVGGVKSFDVSPTATEFTITGLEPASTYNVTLTLKDQMDGAWGVYSTLPPGWYLPRNLKHCDQTPFATSLSWEPVEANMASEYQVRYIHLHSSRTLWKEEEAKFSKYLLCPKDPCGRHCYLVFNLDHNPDDYAFMVRAKVDGIWNNWKLAGRPTIADQPDVKERCCIVPPPYKVESIGHDGTHWDVPIAPSPTDHNITRYYVVVDERDPPGDTNWTMLTDKVTAHRLHIPYYVTASYSTQTLESHTNVRIGNGSVIGGYLNYPLQKGKTYHYEIYTKWMMHGDQPVIARQRPEAFLAAGWPWWWLLLLLLLLLLLCLLLSVLLFWLLKKCGKKHYRNGQHEPLIKEKYERYEHTRGNFEDGYSQGYRAGRGGRRVEEDWRGRDEAFREGYAKGLRDTGDRGMSTSMANLAQRPTQRLGYSSGYMQGFRDGSSGVFGDRITESLLKRLEEQYPDNEEFRTGYIDGFKDGVGGGRFEDSRRIQQRDEIHSTKIYHVYNQSPEMLAQGQQLVSELEELASGSKRSTLRRHYTPGDYLRYDEASGEYNSLGRSRRSMSATALGRGGGEQQQTSAITTTHQWPEDLIEIVHEPMGQTLDRMRRFSTSLSNVERTEGGTSAAAETEKVDHQEKYKRTYREEYS
uniref:Fibronectin type-III domain-containing protein n=1 Tax=Meloidogyne enterolobii TaxID=390850 RepID=A0A6V7UFL7_MELEN|nr:unnamed protein product [Meloidogyne enterolobii]